MYGMKEEKKKKNILHTKMCVMISFPLSPASLVLLPSY